MQYIAESDEVGIGVLLMLQVQTVLRLNTVHALNTQLLCMWFESVQEDSQVHPNITDITE